MRSRNNLHNREWRTGNEVLIRLTNLLDSFALLMNEGRRCYWFSPSYLLERADLVYFSDVLSLKFEIKCRHLLSGMRTLLNFITGLMLIKFNVIIHQSIDL